MEIFSFLVVETRWYVNLVILDDLLLQSINNISWEWNQWWMLCWTNIYQRDHLIPDSRSPTLQSSDLCSRLNNFTASQNTFCYSVKRINFGAQIEKGDFYLTKHKATIIWTLLFCIFGVYDRLKDLLVYQARSKWAILQDFDKDCDCEVVVVEKEKYAWVLRAGLWFHPILEIECGQQTNNLCHLLALFHLSLRTHAYLLPRNFQTHCCKYFLCFHEENVCINQESGRGIYTCVVCHKLQCWL